MLRFLAWALGIVFAVAAIYSAVLGSAVGGVFYLAAAAVATPPLWQMAYQRGVTLTRKWRAGTIFALWLAGAMFAGAAEADTPEARAQAAMAQAEEDKQRALQQVADAKAEQQSQKLATARRAQEVAAEKQRVMEEKAASALTTASGVDCLSGWDGSYRALVDVVKQNARNPSSFEHIGTVIEPIGKDDLHTVVMRYRAQNGFGGMNIEYAGAKVSSDCKLVETI